MAATSERRDHVGNISLPKFQDEKLVRITSVFLALLFIAAGASKLAGVDLIVERFESWGYPPVFRNLVGLMEILFAAFLLAPKGAAIGGFGLAMLMLGAIYTHLFRGNALLALIPLSVLALLLWVGMYRGRARFLPDSFGGRGSG